MFQNNETAAMLVYQGNPVGVWPPTQTFSGVRHAFLPQERASMLATWVKTLYSRRRITTWLNYFQVLIQVHAFLPSVATDRRLETVSMPKYSRHYKIWDHFLEFSWYVKGFKPRFQKRWQIGYWYSYITAGDLWLTFSMKLRIRADQIGEICSWVY